MAYLATLFIFLIIFAAFKITGWLDRREQKRKNGNVDRRRR